MLKKYLWIAAALNLVWGAVPAASQFVINQIPVELYIALRWTISGFIFLCVLGLTEGFATVFQRSSILVAVLGLLGYGFGSMGTLYGLKIGGVANFALMSALSPLLTTVASILFLRERPSRWFYLALPISILGSVLVIYGKYELSSLQIAFSSMALIIGAYVFEAIVFVYSKRMNHTHTPKWPILLWRNCQQQPGCGLRKWDGLSSGRNCHI